jgi:hypothetical protein
MPSRLKLTVFGMNPEIKERIIEIGPGTAVLHHPARLMFAALPLACRLRFGIGHLRSAIGNFRFGVALG